MQYQQYLSEAIKTHTCFDRRTAILQTKKAYHLGYGIDDRYARCMAASIVSIYQHNQEENLVFHILCSALKPATQAKIQRLTELFPICLHLYEVEANAFQCLPTQAHLPVSTYYRFILPLLLQEDRVLYLDADIICLGQITSLFALDLQDKIVAAVPDASLIAHKREAILELPQGTYFNAGVLLMEMKNWRQADIADRALAALAENPKKFTYLDQDALNVTLTGKVYYLEKKWNQIDLQEACVEAAVFLHFAAHPKPWSISWPLSKSCHEVTKDIYHRYERLSPWKDADFVLPQNYKEMKYYARCLWREKHYFRGCYWYGKYLKNKVAKLK